MQQNENKEKTIVKILVLSLHFSLHRDCLLTFSHSMLKFDWSGIQVGYKWVKESTKNGLPHRPMLHIHKHLSVYREHLIIFPLFCVT